MPEKRSLRILGRLAAAAAALLIIGVCTVLYGQRRDAKSDRPSARTAARLPVAAARARRGDIGVYITGLGSVTPLNTITVKTRIDGQLMSVSYREGEMVRKGAPLVEIDPRPSETQLAQAEAQLAKDEAALQNARVDLHRYESLIERNAVAQQVLAAQRATVAQDEGLVKADEANVATAKLNVSYCHITAPLTGRVGLRLVDPGNMVSASGGTPLVVIAQTQPISVIFTVSEQQLGSVRAPLRAGQRLRVDALDRDLQTVLATGELTTIDNEIDQTTGTVKLRATVPNRDEALFPNQFVNTRLLVQEKHGVTLVPNAAVQRNASATFLYLVKPDQSVTIRKITVGASNAEESEILSGVAPGDAVVTQGSDKLQDGVRVAAQLQDE